MSDTNISIRVSAANLRNILSSSPDAMIELEHTAAEKVAEQLVNKIVARKEEYILGRISEQISGFVRDPSSEWDNIKLGKKTEQIISSKVEAIFKQHEGINMDAIEASVGDRLMARLQARLRLEAEARDKQMSEFMNRLNEWWSKNASEQRSDIARVARAEFMNIVSNVPSITETTTSINKI